MPWSDEDKRAICRAFYVEGLSAGTIAATYGDTSRSAILGLIHRNGKALGYGAKTGGAPKGPKRMARGAPKPPKPARTRIRALPRAPEERPPVQLVARAEPDPVRPPLALPFGDLGSGQCQFAVTPHHVAPAGHRFCGHPVAQGRWCAHHARLVRQS